MQSYLPGIEENIFIYGRTKKQNPLPLFWTGSGVELVTDATELYFEIESDYSIYEQWIRIEVNHHSVIRMAVPKGKTEICVFRGMNPLERKRVRLYKEVQPMQADKDSYLLLHEVRCDGELYSVEKKHRIEFIGDSITSGEGLCGNETMQDWIPMVFTTQNHYVVRTAEKLDADFRVISQSGWGTYCSWDNVVKNNLPRYYEQICGVLEGEKNGELGAYEPHSFEDWEPEVIVVNLGCNDANAFENPAWVDADTGIAYKQKKNPDGTYEEESIARFENAVYDFLKKLRRNNPDSYILWAYGMIGNVMEPYILKALRKYQEESGDMRTDYQRLPDLQPGWIGARQHPGVKSHEAASDVLLSRIKELLKER